ncbi:hypothetical protein A3K64_02765 [Candidatus Micrarchaeota archaeon RBG_16_36_9]|nr:MAG: hypothetical protein A3K64_02765 [Candidatus Micrarchaeota archaeon RBG_16_36_9]
MGEALTQLSGYSTDMSNYNQDVKVDNKTITTDEGKREITRLEKPFTNDNVQGMAIDEVGLTIINQNAVFDKDYVDIHEDDHLRYKNTFEKFAGMSRYFPSHIVEELANRKISDFHYEILRGRKINTAGTFSKQIREMLNERNPSELVEDAMRDLENTSEICYQNARKVPIDIHKEYKNIKEKTSYIV